MPRIIRTVEPRPKTPPVRQLPPRPTVVAIPPKTEPPKGLPRPKVPPKKLNHSGLQIHYLYTKQAEIRFDVICPTLVHVMVTTNNERDLAFKLIVSTEDAREIWTGLKERGAKTKRADC